MEALRPFNGDIRNIGVCPEASEQSGDWGSVNKTWGPNNNPSSYLYNAFGSYGFNGWLYNRDVTNPRLRGGEVWGLGPASNYIDLPTPEASRVPAFIDSAWVDVWPLHTDNVTEFRTAGHGYVFPEMPRCCLKRHAGRFVNASFVDGHAETIRLPELWQLKWSNGFVATIKQIPGF